MLVHIHIYFSSELRSLTHRGGKKRGGSDGDVGLLHSDNYGYLGHFGCKSKLLLCSQNNLEKKTKTKRIGKERETGIVIMCIYLRATLSLLLSDFKTPWISKLTSTG